MPKVDLPLRNADSIKSLKANGEFQRDAARLVALAGRMKRYAEEASELRGRLYDHLSSSLPAGEKSVRYGSHRLSIYEGEPRKTLDKQKLLAIIPASKLEKCYTEGERPCPTVQVVDISEQTRDEAKEKRTKKQRTLDGVKSKLRRGLD